MLSSISSGRRTPDKVEMKELDLGGLQRRLEKMEQDREKMMSEMWKPRRPEGTGACEGGEGGGEPARLGLHQTQCLHEEIQQTSG